MFARRFHPVFLPTFTPKQSSLILFGALRRSFAVSPAGGPHTPRCVVPRPRWLLTPPLWFVLVGACWPSLRRPESPQLLLGGRRLHLQVLRGDSGRPVPQSHQAQPRHPVDHKACAQAQRDARPDVCRKEEPRPGQGPQVPPDHRRLPSRCLEEAQHPAAAPLPLERSACLYIQKINILFMVTLGVLC